MDAWMRQTSVRTRVSAVAVAVLLIVAALLLAIRQPFIVVAPAPELRSYGAVPTVLAGPAFYAAPIPAGISVDQELRLTENDVAVRLWLGPARQGETARARIELLGSLHGPSLRSGEVSLDAPAGDQVARIVPPLRQSELGDDGSTVLRVTSISDTSPLSVGMASGATYPEGRASIAGEPQPEDVDLMFEVARQLSLGDVWSEALTLIGSDTLAIRAVAAIGPLVLAAGLAAATLARNRRIPVGVGVVVVALMAGCLIVLDRTLLSFLPGPDFNPVVFLR